MPTIHYQLTHNEAVGTAFRRRMAQRGLWAFEGAMLFVALSLTLMGPPGDGYALIFSAIAIAMPFAIYFALSTAISRARWLMRPTTLEFDEKSLRMSMGDVRQEVGWTVFQRWTRTPEHFFLYPGSGPNALTIPVRAFDAATLEDFTRRLESLGPAR